MPAIRTDRPDVLGPPAGSRRGIVTSGAGSSWRLPGWPFFGCSSCLRDSFRSSLAPPEPLAGLGERDRGSDSRRGFPCRGVVGSAPGSRRRPSDTARGVHRRPGGPIRRRRRHSPSFRALNCPSARGRPRRLRPLASGLWWGWFWPRSHGFCFRFQLQQPRPLPARSPHHETFFMPPGLGAGARALAEHRCGVLGFSGRFSDGWSVGFREHHCGGDGCEPAGVPSDLGPVRGPAARRFVPARCHARRVPGHRGGKGRQGPPVPGAADP